MSNFANGRALLHIYYDFHDGPWGGGNQFLKSLRAALRVRGTYAEDMNDAAVILVNSHHFQGLEGLARLCDHVRAHPYKRIIHRLDGPVRLIRGRDDGADRLIFAFNALYADGTVIQSEWCRAQCRQHGYEAQPGQAEAIIMNAADPAYFYPVPAYGSPLPLSAPETPEDAPVAKIRLIATSWSANKRKGFEAYQWMDRHLDWDRYEMKFVGNAPVKFKNIRHCAPVDSAALGDHLRGSDIYVTASRNDPCSNALIEALQCGLPALAYHDGGHPEIIGAGGLTFTDHTQIPEKLSQLARNLNACRKQIDVPSIAHVAAAYESLACDVQRKSSRAQVDERQQNDFIGRYRRYGRKVNGGGYINSLMSFIRSE